MRTWVMPSSAHSSTIFRNRSTVIIPCLRCMSSRGQKTHFALQMFVLSIWTISGIPGARSRPVASSSRRIGLAWLRRTFSTVRRARALILRDWDIRALKLPEVFDDASEGFIELNGGLVADEGPDPRDVRNPPRHVFEPRLVRLVVRDGHDFRLAAGQFLDLRGQLTNRDLVAVADIEDLADGARFVNQGYHSAHHVPDVGEAARLRAVAEHGNGLPCERLLHEI